MKAERHAIRRGHPNVFVDLGFEAVEAEHLQLRSQLMIALTKVIRERKWTQTVAAEHLGVSQPRVSDLTRGRIDRFSIDALVEMLGRAGMTVTVGVRKRRRVA